MENLEQKRKVAKKLREWRENQARKDGVELFRIISNDAVNGIVEALPTTKEALLEVKGIAEKKLQKYGRDILAIVAGEVSDNLFSASAEAKEGSETIGFRTRSARGADLKIEKIFTVSDYLDLLNAGIQQFEAKVVGEISSLDIRGNYLFFGVKDKDGSSMSCFMWASNYRISGVILEEGLEVMLSGFPKIHKPSGRISFEVNTVELVGEGALKKAYLELKKKLEKEGLFSEERKKPIPEYPQRIGLITSSTGAVIHDFLNNIGKFGFKISFRDSRVEGALAVRELVSAVRYFKKIGGIDVLVMIRGGGSLESLQAFNNETLVREIADCPFPVMVGIGHDKDVPLVSLVADKAASTPTAVAKALNATWEQALSKVRFLEQRIFGGFSALLHEKKEKLWRFSSTIENGFRGLLQRFRIAEERLQRSAITIGHAIAQTKDALTRFQKTLIEKFQADFRRSKENLLNTAKIIALNDPERELRLGYSIAFSKGKVVRRVEDVKAGEEVDIRVGNGTIITNVSDKKK
ncbi:MAG: exodeoxyribonuclease VII large subunit [Parcubacteria group bacterium]|nr:exodeoxyribonuclease VII large subunit [Parcubacteria group bacterium]